MIITHLPPSFLPPLDDDDDAFVFCHTQCLEISALAALPSGTVASHQAHLDNGSLATTTNIFVLLHYYKAYCFNGETSYLLLYDHHTAELDGVCRVSKAAHVDKDLANKYVYIDHGGELYKSMAIRDLFEREFHFSVCPTGTEAHHPNDAIERSTQTVDNTIRATLYGAGLPIKFWTFAFYHYLRVKNAALPRRELPQSVFRRQPGTKDDAIILSPFL